MLYFHLFYQCLLQLLGSRISAAIVAVVTSSKALWRSTVSAVIAIYRVWISSSQPVHQIQVCVHRYNLHSMVLKKYQPPKGSVVAFNVDM